MVTLAVNPQDRAALDAAEQRRVQCLRDEDFDRLATLLDEQLVHVHSTGIRQDKAAYLHYVRHTVRYLALATTVQAWQVQGDVAWGQLALEHRMQRRADGETVSSRNQVLQVWRRSATGWRLCAFQATRAAD